ncbi:MAG: DNA (cytosine-5-)-methyltransferase [Lachnospiraceae bacterium]
MIKLATVFSGIGAIEQALKRMNISHETLFACDNGERIIDINYDSEMEKVRSLSSVKEKREYVDKLYVDNTKKKNFVRQSYMANYEIVDDNFFEDVKLLDGTDFKGKVDLFVGGSPCQSFSIIGAKGGFNDTRGTLFYEYARLVKEIEPKVFIYENVYGLTRHDKGKTWSIMQQVFEELGYHYTFKILDSRNYGIPQGRRRILVVGFKEESAFEKFHFPDPIDLEYTMQDFLEENTAIGSLQSVDGKLKKVNDLKGEPEERYYLSEKLQKYCLSPGTKNFMHADAKIDLPIARALLSTMGNSHRSSVNNYVTTNGCIRAITINEAHRLMGFPDSYKIVVSKAQAYKQAGNSIVVDVLIHLVREIINAEGGIIEKMNVEHKKYKVASLFSGIGGLDLGFEFAGFDVVWANDFDKYAVETYKANVGNNIVHGDIREVMDQIPQHDVLIGGFPCQPFSTLGKLKGFEDEERGSLFFVIKEILKKSDTKVVVLENVKNIVNHDGGRTFERIKKELDQIGFTCFSQILNSKDYGVPQRRNRMFLVGVRRDYFDVKEFDFPEKREFNITTQDLLDEDVDEKYFLTKKIEPTILGFGTKGYIVKPTIDQEISKTLCATMHKMHRASQDNYVTDKKNFEKFSNDKRIPVRKLTPNECRQLQGFPSDWTQVVSDTQAYKQFGNAVTVNVSYAVADKLIDYMNNNMKKVDDNGK